jgi:hypothetical protein
MAVNSLSYIDETCYQLWIFIKLFVRPSIIGVHAENVSKIVRQTSKEFFFTSQQRKTSLKSISLNERFWVLNERLHSTVSV